MDVIYAYLDGPVLDEILEESMNVAYQPISPYFKQLLGRGRAEGMARMLERLLDRRSLEPSAEQRQRMTSCSDEVQLQRWFDRAVTATSTAEIFEG